MIDPSTYDFPIGTTSVTWEVTDNAGLKASANQNVTVTDNEKPTITAPSAKTANTNDDGTGNCTTTVDLGTPTTAIIVKFTIEGFVDGKVIDPSTYNFPIGTTGVTWEVTDNAGLKQPLHKMSRSPTMKHQPLPLLRLKQPTPMMMVPGIAPPQLT